MATMYDALNIYPLDTEVIQKKLENQLTTALDMNNFITVDYSLEGQDGNVMKVLTYKGTGNVEDLAMGAKNSDTIGAGFEPVEYRVVRTQGTVKFYDQQRDADDAVVDKSLEHLTEAMINDNTAKVVAEWAKGTNKRFGFDFSYAAIVRARAAMKGENKEGIFMMVNSEDAADLMITLASQLQYVEAYIRSDYIGSIAGMPVYISDGIPKGTAFLATREAVTAFYKRQITVETARDIENQENTVVAHTIKVIALTNNDKVVVLSAGADPRTGYTVLNEAPVDWATDYNDYYTYDAVAGKMVKNSFDAAPTFVAGVFYSKD